MRGPCPEGGHNPCRRVEDALSTSPQGTGPIPDAPEVAGLAPPAALTFAGRLGALWGHCVEESRSCCSSMFSLKIPREGFLISLCRTQLWPPTPQRQQGAPLVHTQLQREVGVAPPSPVLGSWEQSEGDTGAQSSCRQGVTWQLCLPVGAPWSCGSQPAWGCPSLGSLRIWNHGVLGYLSHLFSTRSWRFCSFSCVCFQFPK